MATETTLPLANEEDEDEDRYNRPVRRLWRMKRDLEISPPGLHSSGSESSFERRHSPPPMDYDFKQEEQERKAIRKIKRKLPKTERDFYTYIPIKPFEIRLVLLCPGKDDDPIHCSSKTLPLEKIKNIKLRYQALSYSWGEDHPTDVIYVRDISVPLQDDADATMIPMSTQVKPRPFAVRPNLLAALKRLRSTKDDVWLWVDAICINQKDDHEKNHQLPKMPDIYRNAWNVAIWIGDYEGSEVDSDCAMDFLPSILNLTHLDRMLKGGSHDEETLKSWVAFAKILKRPWFSRRWVIQEIAFANRASVRCGSRVVN
jgi:hypothetical protein